MQVWEISMNTDIKQRSKYKQKNSYNKHWLVRALFINVKSYPDWNSLLMKRVPSVNIFADVVYHQYMFWQALLKWYGLLPVNVPATLLKWYGLSPVYTLTSFVEMIRFITSKCSNKYQYMKLLNCQNTLQDKIVFNQWWIKSGFFDIVNITVCLWLNRKIVRLN